MLLGLSMLTQRSLSQSRYPCEQVLNLEAPQWLQKLPESAGRSPKRNRRLPVEVCLELNHTRLNLNLALCSFTTDSRERKAARSLCVNVTRNEGGVSLRLRTRPP